MLAFHQQLQYQLLQLNVLSKSHKCGGPGKRAAPIYIYIHISINMFFCSKFGKPTWLAAPFSEKKSTHSVDAFLLSFKGPKL